MIERHIEGSLIEALEDTPVLLINGARQSGKSTLVKKVFSETHQYVTLDDVSVLAGIKYDAVSFLEGLNKPTIIDEIQRAPELFIPLKKVVDENRRAGFFVLTGSVNVMTLPKLSESLAGRMEIHTLWPLSQGEILGHKEGFIEKIFGEGMAFEGSGISKEDLAHRVTVGGYPDAMMRKTVDRRSAWFKSYLTTLLERDIRELSHIEGLTEIPKLVNLLGTRIGSLLNNSELSRTMGMAGTTLKRYLALLELIYIMVPLPAWSRNAGKRLVKSPKIYLNDTGLLTNLLFCDDEKLLSNPGLFGHVLENFVVMEILKQKTWSRVPFNVYHYRTVVGKEVDIVLERGDSRLVGIEIKLSKSVTASDFVGLVELEESESVNFHRGVVLYLGEKVVPFGPNKYAVPLGALWMG